MTQPSNVTAQAARPRLRMRDVQKAFGATRALNRVTFEIGPGEVHALIGENGAGKSTLMKVLSGAYVPDDGTIELDGETFSPEDPHHARQCGIGMIYQELTLASHLSVEANIVLGNEPRRFGWLNPAKTREIARKALSELHHESIPLDAPVGDLTIAEKQIVEIARAIAGNPKVLIMDEPTSSLSQVDTENLFAVIGRLAKRGVSVIYISHFLEECQRVCDRYTVLRDGETVGSGEIKSAKLNDIIRMMVGRDVKEIYPRTERPLGKVVMEVRNLAGETKPSQVNFSLREGEILGISGLIGTGRTEALRACFGLDPVRSGQIDLWGREATHGTPHTRLDAGVGLLSENRKEEGLLLNRSLADNLTLTHFAPVSRHGLVNFGMQERTTQEWIEKLEVKAQGPKQMIGELSGGNQQKIAIARLLHHDAKILLFDEPTRGIDVKSKAQIYKLMFDLASQGRAVVFVSSYLPELLGVCDTIGVMCRGVLSTVKPVAQWTEHSIIAAAIGHELEADHN